MAPNFLRLYVSLWRLIVNEQMLAKQKTDWKLQNFVPQPEFLITIRTIKCFGPILFVFSSVLMKNHCAGWPNRKLHVNFLAQKRFNFDQNHGFVPSCVLKWRLIVNKQIFLICQRNKLLTVDFKISQHKKGWIYYHNKSNWKFWHHTFCVFMCEQKDWTT